MIVRIVKLTFRVDAVDAFEAMFEARKALIRNQEGCTHVALWKDIKEPNVYFTYSHWAAESYLDNYRRSAFFRETWSLTKALFAARAEAWSVMERSVVA